MANELLAATTPHAAEVAPKRFLQPADAVVVIELLHNESTRSGPHSTSLSARGLSVSHRTTDGGIGVWTLTAQTREHPRHTLRPFRLHVLRFHAEWTVLRTVCRAVARDGVLPSPRTREMDNLTELINRGIGYLDGTEWIRGQQRSALLEVYDAFEFVSPGEREALLDNLRGMRGNIRRKLITFLEARPGSVHINRVKEFHMTSSENRYELSAGGDVVGNINLGQGNTQFVQRSIQRIDGADTSQELNDVLRTMTAVVAKAAEQQPGPQAQRAQTDFEYFRELCLQDDSPDPSLLELVGQKLKSFASFAGSVAAPLVDLVDRVLALFR